tara:strand:+ start:443 stop:634 length:192 start_codon:yes stop_codon:yes gene_type:complete
MPLVRESSTKVRTFNLFGRKITVRIDHKKKPYWEFINKQYILNDDERKQLKNAIDDFMLNRYK